MVVVVVVVVVMVVVVCILSPVDDNTDTPTHSDSSEVKPGQACKELHSLVSVASPGLVLQAGPPVWGLGQTLSRT